jgi:aconitate hydratase
MESTASNPFSHVKKDIQVNGSTYSFFSLPALGDERVKTLPYSIRVLLESAVRNCDDFNVKSKRYLYIINKLNRG